jgi:hypothetical protein
VVESKRKGSILTSPQPEARHSPDFVDTVVSGKLYSGGGCSTSARSRTRRGHLGLGLVTQMEKQNAGKS